MMNFLMEVAVLVGLVFVILGFFRLGFIICMETAIFFFKVFPLHRLFVKIIKVLQSKP